MKTNPIKSMRLLLTCLIGCALFNVAQAAPSVTVQSYAKHAGSNTVYTYRVTNHGPERLFRFNIGCNCANAGDNRNSEPQLVIYPVGYNFETEYGGDSESGYAAPPSWKGGVRHYEDIGFISFEFDTIWGSGVSLLPGYTQTFSIITSTKDDSGMIRLFASGRGGDEAFFYDKNKRGYLQGHFSYREDDAAGKTRVVSYPMQLLDQTPPRLSVGLSPDMLWQNSRMVSVDATIAVADDYDPEAKIKLVSITANQTLANGDIRDAQIGTDDRNFTLATQRDNIRLTGRIYTVTYSATDASGNMSTASTTVAVRNQ